MAARRWRKSSSTSRAESRAWRRHNERRDRALAAPGRRHGAAPPLSVPRLLAARLRDRLLADPHHGALGLHQPVPCDEQQLGRARGWRADLRGAALGSAVPGTAGRRFLVLGRNVVAQSRPSLRESAPTLRVGAVAARDELPPG